MPIAHVCPRCGESLTTVRGEWSTSLAAPVVTCPTCRFACVRRRPEVVTLVRDLARCRAACAALLWRLGVPFILWLITLGIGTLAVEIDRVVGWRTLFTGSAADFDAALVDNALPPLRLLLVLIIGAGVATGALIAAMGGHLASRFTWPAVYLSWVVLSPLIIGALHAADVAGDPYASQAPAAVFKDALEGAVGVAAVALIGAPLGVPVGLRLRALGAAAAARRVPRMLRRARKKRQSLRSG